MNTVGRIPTAESRITTALLVVASLAAACGKKGPPLPPLIKQPQPPAEIAAVRHGDTVDVQFVVPSANVDGSKPANVARVDVYGITAPPGVTEDQILKLGTKIGSVPVKAPRDPDKTVEPDDPDSDVEPPEGRGVDQGTLAHVSEQLTPEAAVAVDVKKVEKPRKAAPPPARDIERPLLAPTVIVPSRSYIGVAVSAKGKRGHMSPAATVAMVEPPAPPAAPAVTYDEKAISVSWPQVGGPPAAPTAGAAAVLPSTPIGPAVPSFAYNVYDVSEATPPVLTRLTKAAIDEPRFSDSKIVWDERRCYAVRVVETINDVSVESMESAPSCITLTDTFPPAAPKGLQAVASDGAINLIWDANPEKDVRGYIVMRGIAPAETLEPVTPEPIRETSFKDNVKPGVRFVFAVRAVDAAGNMSPLSERVEETAR